jgi:hypothetical protein
VATDSGHGVELWTMAGSEVDIAHNTFDEIPARSGAAWNIYAENCDQLRITDNRMIGPSGAKAIDCVSCTNITVKRNDSDNHTTNGITTTAFDQNSWGDSVNTYLSTGITGFQQLLTSDGVGTYSDGDTTPTSTMGRLSS